MKSLRQLWGNPSRKSYSKRRPWKEALRVERLSTWRQSKHKWRLCKGVPHCPGRACSRKGTSMRKVSPTSAGSPEDNHNHTHLPHTIPTSDHTPDLFTLPLHLPHNITPNLSFNNHHNNLTLHLHIIPDHDLQPTKHKDRPDPTLSFLSL